MKINPRWNEYVAVDIKGNDIPGTNSYRKSYPKTGRWRKITPQPCCAAFNLSAVPADLSDTSFVVTILCGVANIIVATVTVDVATVTIDDVTSALNKRAGFLGRFSNDGTNIELQLLSTVGLNCADTDTLSMTIV